MTPTVRREHALRFIGVEIVCGCGANFGSDQRAAVAHIRSVPEMERDAARLRDMGDWFTVTNLAPSFGISAPATRRWLRKMAEAGRAESRSKGWGFPNEWRRRP